MENNLLVETVNSSYFSKYIFSLSSYVDRYILCSFDSLDENKIDAISLSGQLTPDGKIVANKFGKSNKKIYYNDSYVLDKTRKIIKQYNTKNMHHECIYGTNMPRYYTPSFDYSKLNENLLYINYDLKYFDKIYNEEIINNNIVELDENGNIIWEWSIVEHYDELDISENEKKEILNSFFNRRYVEDISFGIDFFDLNSACKIGENKWYDDGDDRFNPDNIICSSCSLKRIFIIEKSTGNIVYILKDLDDDFCNQYYAHIIPSGLLGNGNILFSNNNFITEKVHIYEVNPINKEIIFKHELNDYSPMQVSVQKLEDGNYFLGISNSRMLQVVSDSHEIIGECFAKASFCRANLYPKEWYFKYEYTQDDIDMYKEYANDIEETILLSEKDAVLYEQYLNQLIMSQEALTELLSKTN